MATLIKKISAAKTERHTYDTEAIRQKMLKLLTLINTRVIGMPEVVRGVLLAMLSNDAQFGEHLFMIGIPGVGKSWVMDVWASCLDLTPDQLFDYLFHPFSTPDELTGPQNIKKLLTEHIMERDIKGFLPSSHFAILDEIWKSGPASTTLFKIVNERKYRNGSNTVNCPLITALAASNEYPSNKMDTPLWDRLLFRFTSVLLFRVLAHPVKNRTIIMMPATVGSINGFPEACHFTPGRLQSFPVFIQFLF